MGNVRAVFAVTQQGTAQLRQKTDYYPFGMVMNQSPHTGNGPENKFLYNGKEIQDDVIANIKLDWYDYGARMYDAAVGRWHVVDPHAENYFNASPYTYVENNPIIRIDPDGRDWYEDKEGNLVWHTDLTYDNRETFFADNNIEGTYLGEMGWSTNEEGFSILHGVDGSERAGYRGLNEVVITAEMGDHARTMSNPLVKANHSYQNSFLAGAAELTIEIAGTTGTVLKGAGYICAATGVGAPLGAQLIGAGSAFSSTASVLKTGLYLSQGRTDAALYTAISGTISHFGTRAIRSSSFSIPDKVILNFWLDLTKTPIDKTLGTSIEGKGL